MRRTCTVSNPNVQPLAQDFVVAAQVPEHDRYFFHDPNMTRLDDGGLLIAAPQWGPSRYGTGPRKDRPHAMELRIIRSEDGGRTWEDLPTLDTWEGTPFVVGGQLLMFVQEKQFQSFQIVSSDDRGETWTSPKTVIDEPLWNIGTAMVERPDALYWAMSYDTPGDKRKGKVMVRLDRSMSPLDPDAWSMSNIVTLPEIPGVLTRNLFQVGESPQLYRGADTSSLWLEPNTVEVAGRIRVFTRCVIDDYSTAHLAGVLDYDADANRLSFTQLTSWPGGQCKFYVIHDRPNRMYWMLSNLVTNSQDYLGWGERMGNSAYFSGPGNERRWLYLHYSIDCLNWFPAGCVARWPGSVHRSFMYPTAAIDGEDLVILSRTSRDASEQHGADLCTVHRVRNFRDLAMDLHTGGLHDGTARPYPEFPQRLRRYKRGEVEWDDVAPASSHQLRGEATEERG